MLMWLCSSLNTPPCYSLKLPITVFEDHYSCVLFGYEYSSQLFQKQFTKEAVNETRAYTKFACIEQKLKSKETNA